MIKRPLMRVQDLTGDERKLMLYLIREFSKPIVKELGVDCTEEAMISLINQGILKFCMDEEHNFWMERYNYKTDEYERI